MQVAATAHAEQTYPETIRVLVADGSSAHAGWLRQSLARRDQPTFTVDSAHTLERCRELAENATQFDCILLDLNLDDADGLDALDAVKTLFPGTPALIIAASENEVLGMRSMARGAEDFLQQSHLRSPLMASVIRYAVERTRLRDQLQGIEQRRELENAERLSARPRTQITAQIYDGKSLREAYPADHARFCEQYCGFLDGALERRLFKIDGNSAELQAFVQALGYRRAGPRDLVEIHVEALKSRITQLPVLKSQAFIEEGRYLLLELMGHLAAYYRIHYCEDANGKSSIETLRGG